MGTFPRILGLYSRDKSLFTLEEAVRRMTSLPAKTFGLKDRGVIRENSWADLVIFDRNRILDTATFEKPFSFPVGIEYVIVNGSTVLAHQQFSKSLPGSAIRREQPARLEPVDSGREESDHDRGCVFTARSSPETPSDVFASLISFRSRSPKANDDH
jgi:N-acyl-D-aspartate/D-glutamate deacylase